MRGNGKGEREWGGQEGERRARGRGKGKREREGQEGEGRVKGKGKEERVGMTYVPSPLPYTTYVLVIELTCRNSLYWTIRLAGRSS